jgi:hypothetical protein
MLVHVWHLVMQAMSHIVLFLLHDYKVHVVLADYTTEVLTSIDVATVFCVHVVTNHIKLAKHLTCKLSWISCFEMQSSSTWDIVTVLRSTRAVVPQGGTSIGSD